MIASLSGKVLAILDDSINLDVQGVGFEVFLSKNSLQNLSVGQTQFYHIYFLLRQDAMALYGFETMEEKNVFVQLLGAGGVGPKLAMNILSHMSMDAIRRAIVNEQADLFSRVPGVGKKTAQKILIHMQGKLTALSGDLSPRYSDVDDAVLEALTTLGYSVVEAQTALQALPKDCPNTVEDKLRLALQYFDH